MNAPLVSVLMTAYNREKYIAEAIESVLASTYKNFELIIVDDGSTDATVAIARTYAAQDERIKVYLNEKNLGDYPNRNKAASYASGKYLKYVDSDDKVYPHSLQVMVEAIEKLPEAVWGVSAAPGAGFNRPYPFLLQPEEIFEYAMRGERLLSRAPSSMIFGRDSFEKEKGFVPVRQWGDAEFCRRLAMQYPVVVMQPDLLWYRVHEGQESVINQHYKPYNIVAGNAFVALYKSDKCLLGKSTIKKYILAERKKQVRIILGCIKRFRLLQAFALLKLVLTNVQR